MERPIEIFFSYAHEDEKLVEDVRLQLVVFDRQGIIRKWHDRLIPPGIEWKGQIDSRLQNSDIVLLFISPSFFGSDYCYDVEMAEAMNRHGAGAARVIPIILRPCMWQEAPFAKIQALPIDGKAITTWENRDEACLNVAQGIMRAVRELFSNSPASGASPDQRRSPLASTPAAQLLGDRASVAELSSLRCTSPLCQSQDLDLTDATEISSLKAGEDCWTVHGIVHIEYCVHGRCRTCGRVFEAAKRQIPVQFPELECNECGKRALLQYRVQELRKVEGGFEFSVEIRCSGCRGRKVLTKVLMGLLSAIGIDVGREGISVNRGA